jgi:hypothetical protein
MSNRQASQACEHVANEHLFRQADAASLSQVLFF